MLWGPGGALQNEALCEALLHLVKHCRRVSCTFETSQVATHPSHASRFLLKARNSSERTCFVPETRSPNLRHSSLSWFLVIVSLPQQSDSLWVSRQILQSDALTARYARLGGLHCGQVAQGTGGHLLVWMDMVKAETEVPLRHADTPFQPRVRCWLRWGSRTTLHRCRHSDRECKARVPDHDGGQHCHRHW
jgi:hypothetical protein